MMNGEALKIFGLNKVLIILKSEMIITWYFLPLLNEDMGVDCN